MSYFTTMNLPAPQYERFEEIFERYKSSPEDAIHAFERHLCSFFEVQAVVTFSNCFTAIALALLHATRSRPRTVAIAGLAYRRTCDIVLWAGLRPVFVDNDPVTLGMSLPHLEERLKSETIGCILMQQPMVNICNPNEYLVLGERYGVPVVFDSVEATGGQSDGKRIGGFGVVEAFSLHPSKVINAAEGGVLTFAQLSQKQAFMTTMCDIGVMAKSGGERRFFGLEPIHAMMGLASLDVYSEMRKKFMSHYFAYKEGLSGSNLFHLVEYDLAVEPNFKSILVELQNNDKTLRARLLQYLEAANIGARPYYAPLHPLTQGWELPNARQLAEKFFFLPIGHSVSVADIGFICEKLLTFESQHPRE
jgi:dTDP-4-amino-4,6-dideoxyglucose